MSNLPFLTPQSFEQTVDGVVCKFYPVTIGTAFKLREPAKAILKALAGLLQNRREDIAREGVETSGPDGTRMVRTTVQAIAPELARVRHEQRTQLLENLVMSLMSDGNATMVAMLIMDSMREHYQPADKNNQLKVQQFVDTVTAPTMVEMLMGVAKANAKLFDPLKGWVGQIGTTLKDSIQGLAEIVQEHVPQPAQPQPQPTETTTTGSGSTSSEP